MFLIKNRDNLLNRDKFKGNNAKNLKYYKQENENHM